MLTKEQIEKFCEGIRREMFTSAIRDEYGKKNPDPFQNRLEYYSEVRTTLSVLFIAGMIDGSQYKIIADALSDAFHTDLKKEEP